MTTPAAAVLRAGGRSSALGPVPVHLFGVLVLAAVMVTRLLALRSVPAGERAALDTAGLWMVGAGFLGSHLVEITLYHPERLARDPWEALRFWGGMSSFGGFAGGALALWICARGLASTVRRRWADAVAWGAVFGWIFGRLGCALTHDHPGARASGDFPLAVVFPDGPRHDLGLYELALTIGLAALLTVARPRLAPRPGALAALLAVTYAGPRFGLDFLRATDVGAASALLTAGDGTASGLLTACDGTASRLLPSGDPRYVGLTAAQYGAFALALWGVWMWRLSHRDAGSSSGAVNPDAPPATRWHPPGS